MNYIFDLDDTLLLNSDISYQASRKVVQDLFRHRKLRKEGNTIVEKVKKIYADRHYRLTKQYMDEGLIELAPRAKEFLENKEVFQAGLTNAPYRSTHYKIRQLGIEGLLDPVLTPRSMERKPDPEGIIKIIEDSGMEKNSFIYVGDSIKDLMAGKRAGVRTILISDEFTKKIFADEHYTSFKNFTRNHT